ncbi:ligand-binding sensor domain-containing protein [Spirosoma fluviale]|nr:two-component regulator propeller domain-containing protein [Spirosoma fluviale]
MAYFSQWLESAYARCFGWYTVVLVVFIAHFRAIAQPASDKFDHLSVKDGLSNNSVNCILQDREGFMWFGTNDGLNKFDGYSFQVFQTDPARPTRSLTDNRILGLCEDHKNRLWVVTEGAGLHEIDKQTGNVTHHPIHTKHENWWNNQLSVYEDRQGILWLCSYGGLIRYEPASHHFTLYPSPKREVPVKCVFEDRQNRFWVATA